MPATANLTRGGGWGRKRGKTEFYFKGEKKKKKDVNKA